MSLPEVLLWKVLKGRSGGLKFRRQYPVGDYVLDFYCSGAKVAVEIDGIAHDMGERPLRDARRDAWLAEQGIEVVRIPAAEVLKSPDSAAEAIVRYCQPLCTPPPPAARAVPFPICPLEKWGGTNWLPTARKSVVEGKSVSVRVDLGGRRHIKKK